MRAENLTSVHLLKLSEEGNQPLMLQPGKYGILALMLKGNLVMRLRFT